MFAPRLLLMALVVMEGLLGLTARAMAQSTCIPWITCPTDNQKGVRREPYTAKTWMLFRVPASPGGDRIYLTNDDVADHVRKAMATYYNLDLAIPMDSRNWDYGDDTFQWGWVPLSDIASNPNRRSGIPAAAMGTNYTNCLITTSIGKFAYNPSDGVRSMCWTGDWCNPPWCTTTLCGDTTNIDYLSAAVHEYGHALGFNHSTTNGATMAPALQAQDSTGRNPLACELYTVIQGYHDNNPAATVTGYSVVRGNGGITVSWLAEQELSTDHYVIERGDGPNGPFVSLMNVPVNGIGVYSVDVPGATSGYYQLTEVESDGDSWPLRSEPDGDLGTLPTYVQQSINFDSTLASLYRNRVQLQHLATGPTQYYIYCPDSLKYEFQELADAHTLFEGVPTELVTYESIGGPIGVKAHIASHLPNGGWILNVGDAWEGVDLRGQPWRGDPTLYVNNLFTMSTWPNQPQLNISPLTYRRELASQPFSLSYWTPFVATPAWTVDFNNDGLPDPGYYLGFAPVSNRTEAQVFVAKSIQIMFRAANPPANQMSPAAVMTYARNFGSNSGARAKLMSDSIFAYVHGVNPNLWMTGVTTSDANPLGTAARNSAMKTKFDAGMSSCSFISTVSQRYELGAYAHVDIPGYYFDVNALASNGMLAFGIGITCEMGFSRTEDPAYGTPVTERLLFVPNRGFWGYFGPDRGSFQGGNERIGKIFYRRQYETPLGAIPPTVGELWNSTVREAASFKPDSLLATSYLLVGDPRGRIQSPGPEVVDVGHLTAVDRPLSMLPNPTHGAVTFAFSLSRASSVDLSIYDVAGRRVATVLRSFLSAGSQAVRWNAHDVVGQSPRAGLFFARLQVGDRQWQQKVVLLQ